MKAIQHVAGISGVSKQASSSGTGLPNLDNSEFHYSYTTSYLDEFVLGHNYPAVMRELAQNELDAGGNRLSVVFMQDSLVVTGNGRHIDPRGWKRLSVMLGTGSVAGSDRRIESKPEGIGSKNFGLRSLFVFGDRIYVQSGGRQTVLDVIRGALREPKPHPESKHVPGVRIEVPFRRVQREKYQPFDIEQEELALDSFAELALALIKLSQPSKAKGLREVIVASERCDRRITWSQGITITKSRRSEHAVVERSIRVRDSKWKRSETITDLEFQTAVPIPNEFDLQPVPSYFRARENRIMLAISIRLHKGRIDSRHSGLMYYPIGVRNGFTGTAFSINAPFRMDSDRSHILAPPQNPWNAWLLEEAAKLTIGLAKADLLERFGASAYLALRQQPNPAVKEYFAHLQSELQSGNSWPSRDREGNRPKFSQAQDLYLFESVKFEPLLVDGCKLDDRLSGNADIQTMLKSLGAKTFSINSLVRLWCAGEDRKHLATKLASDEADIAYFEFPDMLESETRQARLASGLEIRPRLETSHKHDLKTAPTMLAADGSLQSLANLYAIDPQSIGTSPIPDSQRLHPVLMNSRHIRRLCPEFKYAEWILNIAERVQSGICREDERAALHQYVLATHGQSPRKVKAAIRKCPILLDHRGQWVAPADIMLRGAAGATTLEPVLHFPHPSFEADTKLARNLGFRKKINGDDIIRLASRVQQNPNLAATLEAILQRFDRLLTPPVVGRLKQVAFLPSSRGGIASPQSLYVRSAELEACIGSTAAFAKGRRSSLYKKLGCIVAPKSVDIVGHLGELKAAGRAPTDPLRLYMSLVQAMQREGLMLSSYSQRPIIWNGSGFSAPADTLLGSQYRAVFFDSVPQVSRIPARLLAVYKELGAHLTPQVQHWKRLLSWLGAKYERVNAPLSHAERQALRTAYRTLGSLPEGVSLRLPCLLDREGRLHSLLDAHSARLLIDDDPDLAQAVSAQGSMVSFADDNQFGTNRFFRLAGVKALTEARRSAAPSVGKPVAGPIWFDANELLSHVISPIVVSALTKVAEREFPDGANGVAYAALGDILQSIEVIEFVGGLRLAFNVGPATVFMETDALLHANRLLLARADNWGECIDLVSHALAEALPLRAIESRSFADVVYRILKCSSPDEIRATLRRRKIPWEPSAQEDAYPADEMKSAQYEPLTGRGEESVQTSRGTDVRTPSKSGKQSGVGGSGQSTSGTQLESRPLPALDSVRPRHVLPSGTWSPPASQRASAGRSTAWTPPTPAIAERNSTIGRRGEELVYRAEVARVTGLGFLASRVIWVAENDAGADHDILSVDDDGGERYIEVKSTSGASGHFIWTEAEFRLALREGRRYVLYRVYEADTLTPTIVPFSDPITLLVNDALKLEVGTLSGHVEPLPKA